MLRSSSAYRGPPNASGERGTIVIGHLEGREQRQTRLIAPTIDAAVPSQTAGWPVVDAGICLVLGFMIVLGERWNDLQIFQRRCRAQSALVPILAGKLDRERD